MRISNKDDESVDKLFLAVCRIEFFRVSNNFFNTETFWRNINLHGTTMTYKGNKSPKVYYNGNEKNGFSLMLCINANGNLLNPIIIKKGKTPTKSNFTTIIYWVL
jgi:hypothetical protein